MDELIKIAANIPVIESLLIIDRPVLVHIDPIFTQIAYFACLIVGADNEVFGGFIRFAEVKGNQSERIGSIFVFGMAAVCNGIVSRGFRMFMECLI